MFAQKGFFPGEGRRRNANYAKCANEQKKYIDERALKFCANFARAAPEGTASNRSSVNRLRRNKRLSVVSTNGLTMPMYVP